MSVLVERSQKKVVFFMNVFELAVFVICMSIGFFCSDYLFACKSISGGRIACSVLGSVFGVIILQTFCRLIALAKKKDDKEVS